MQYESERIEYKSQMIDDIYKEVIAFANTDGGVIYIGIDDQGNLTGIDDVDDTYTRLTNGICDAIQPDVTMFIRYILQENKVIRIEVEEGSCKPYYLKSKGLKSTGVYVRQGASSVKRDPPSFISDGVHRRSLLHCIERMTVSLHRVDWCKFCEPYDTAENALFVPNCFLLHSYFGIRSDVRMGLHAFLHPETDHSGSVCHHTAAVTTRPIWTYCFQVCGFYRFPADHTLCSERNLTCI